MGLICMFFITGDTHGDFSRIYDFVNRFNDKLNFSPDKDVMIILGDAGINYYSNYRDYKLKKKLLKLPLTIFSIHGNHEMRPEKIEGYKEKQWYNGTVFYEEEFPNLLFAKDGEVYDFPGGKTLVCGGAYSVDKYYRLQMGHGWWSDEQPSKEIKEKVENTIKEHNGKFHCVLTHTAPEHLEPTEWFLPFLDQSTVDKTTEKWLDKIYSSIDCDIWYIGHYHGDKTINNKDENHRRIEFMFNTISEFV